jgi:hypothetical protein
MDDACSMKLSRHGHGGGKLDANGGEAATDSIVRRNVSCETAGLRRLFSVRFP